MTLLLYNKVTCIDLKCIDKKSGLLSKGLSQTNRKYFLLTKEKKKATT